MAIVLNGATHQLLSANFGASRPTNYTIALWLRADAVSNTTDSQPIALGNSVGFPNDRGDLAFSWGHNTAGFQRTAAVNISGGVYSTSSQGASAATTWKHWTARYNGTHLSFFENGAQVGSDVAAVVSAAAPADWYLAIGSTPSYAARFAGRVCQCAYWDEALTNAECESLGKGFSPLRVSPQNLQYYIPGHRTAQVMRGTAGTAANLTYDENPRLYC